MMLKRLAMPIILLGASLHGTQYHSQVIGGGIDIQQIKVIAAINAQHPGTVTSLSHVIFGSPQGWAQCIPVQVQQSNGAVVNFFYNPVLPDGQQVSRRWQ